MRKPLEGACTKGPGHDVRPLAQREEAHFEMVRLEGSRSVVVRIELAEDKLVAEADNMSASFKTEVIGGSMFKSKKAESLKYLYITKPTIDFYRG